MFGGSRRTAYVKSDEVSVSREDRLNRLKAELREHIRYLSDYELLSNEWFRMAESLHQIANVAFMETHLPANEENPLAQTGKKSQGTLWDQERDELAIKILLEEGKLNLTLRILHKYKEFSRDSGKYDALVKTAVDRFKSDQVAIIERMRVFEQSVGILLKFAFSHVEALQILDMPEFIEHATEVLIDANKSEKKQLDSSDCDKMQETLIIHYLQSIASQIEDLDEDRIMDLIEQSNTFSLLIQHLAAHYQWYKLETLEAAAKTLNGLIQTETFQSGKNRFLKSPDLKKQLIACKGFFIAELVSTYGMKRKDVQALLDELTKLEKLFGAATITPLKPRTTTNSSNAASSAAEKKE
jgi:hypothetical protein